MSTPGSNSRGPQDERAALGSDGLHSGEWITSAQAAAALGITVHSLRRRAKRDAWPTKVRMISGQRRRFYLAAALPGWASDPPHLAVSLRTDPPQGTSVQHLAVRSITGQEWAALDQALADISSRLARLEARCGTIVEALAEIRPSDGGSLTTSLRGPALATGSHIGTSSRPDDWDGDQLRNWREVGGIRRADLAERAGVNVQTIGRWERGERTPGPEYLAKLAEAGFRPTSV